METWTQKEINDCIELCKVKAASDKSFRELLLKNPAAAVQKAFGKAIPEGVKLNIIEADPSYDATFVLPPMISSEVSDENLDSVAGGICVIDTCAMKACAADGACGANK